MKPIRGEVISAAMAKTAIIAVKRTKIHPLYKKRITRLTKFHVHDELGVKPGDQVEFLPVKPISKTKKWAVIKILGKK